MAEVYRQIWECEVDFLYGLLDLAGAGGSDEPKAALLAGDLGRNPLACMAGWNYQSAGVD